MPQVLIAENNTALRKRIVRAITNKNAAVSVREAESAQAAIEILERLFAKGQTVDVVITDIQMPKTSGLMLIAFLNAFMPNMPCLVTTAYNTARLQSKMPSNLLRFFEKPFDVEDLAISALAAMNRQRDPSTCGGINLHNFIYLAAADRATATITVTRDDFTASTFFMENGELIDAVAGNLRGEPAAVLAMSWPAPNYAIETGIPDDIKRTIKTPLSQLLRVSNECFDTL